MKRAVSGGRIPVLRMQFVGSSLRFLTLRHDFDDPVRTGMACREIALVEESTSQKTICALMHERKFQYQWWMKLNQILSI